VYKVEAHLPYFFAQAELIFNKRYYLMSTESWNKKKLCILYNRINII